VYHVNTCYTKTRGVIRVEYQNVTLSLPKEALRRAKHISIEQGTSLSGFLTKLLEDAAHREEDYRMAKKRHLHMLRESNLGTRGRLSWRRGDLHER